MNLQHFARKTIKHLPAGLGFAATRALASSTPRPEISAQEAAALSLGHSLHIDGPDELPAWAWGEGPVVVLVHGWGGRAAQMAPLAAHLASQGFRAIAFDVAGHGLSVEPQARWQWFIRDIARVSQSLGKVAAFIGHSAGGLTMMASRALGGASADRYVCICAPSHPYPPIRGITQRLDPGPGVIERYKAYLGRQFQTTWTALESGSAFAGAGEDLLLCYDEKDRFVEHSEADRIHALCPGSTVIKTRQFGHARILASPELAASVTTFVRGSM